MCWLIQDEIVLDPPGDWGLFYVAFLDKKLLHILYW